MRFAYADPPYPGQSKRWYGDHPDYAGEVDHAELIAGLEAGYPDGWALSTSAAALQDVLGLCPSGVRTAIWHVTNAETPGNRRTHGWHLCWEPVIVRNGRPRGQEQQPIKNLLSCSSRSGFLGAEIAGQKPPAFSRWVFGLLGAVPGDQIDDLYPGSGAVGREWAAYCQQPWIPAVSEPNDGGKAKARNVRRMLRNGVPSLLD